MGFIFELLGWGLILSAGTWMFYQILIGFKDLGLILLNELKFFKYLPKSNFKKEIINDSILKRTIENLSKIDSPSNLNEDHFFTGKKRKVFSNGGSYEGDYINGKKTGKGIHTWKNGNIYEGKFFHDKLTGKGIFKWVSGAIYEGQFNDNTFIEFGKVIDENGNIDGGKWEYDSLKKKNNTKPSKNKNILKEPFFEINRVYRKSDIYKIFNVPKVQQGGKWRNGYCEHNNEFFIFANIGIPGKTDVGDFHYKNEINDNNVMEWEAQNNSKLSWESVQKLKKSNPYIFVRYKDFRSGIYKFIGVGDCMETKDVSPVYFKWKICDYKENNDLNINKKNEFIEVISAVNQFKKIKDKEEKKPIERTTKKIPSSNNIAQEKTKLLDKDLLKEIFYVFVKKTFNIYKREENPFKIKYIHSKALKISYWVFLKNISPAHLSNPDISRIQVENKPVFKEIDEKKELCIPIGYDSINKVFVVWNPDLFLKRILNKRNISIYSRFSDQTNLTENFKEFELTNDEKVFIVNSNFISVFLKNIKTYFKINNVSESSSKQSNTSLLPSSQKELFKYLSDVDNLLESNEVLKAVQIIYETHKDNKDFKNYEFKDWFDLITVYKNHKF
jgi:hypothetical protein